MHIIKVTLKYYSYVKLANYVVGYLNNRIIHNQSIIFFAFKSGIKVTRTSNLLNILYFKTKNHLYLKCFHSFLEVYFHIQKLHIFDVHILMSLDIRIHPLHHRYKQGNKHPSSKDFMSPISFIFIILW